MNNPSAPRLARRQSDPLPETDVKEWTFPCLRIEQGEGREIFCFAVDGKEIFHFASISRISRTDKGVLAGYQRPEVVRHIQSIQSYIDSKGAFIPNAVVISFLKGVTFVPLSESNPNQGRLFIRLLNSGAKPGFIVDGQQRLAAIRDAARASFPIFATAFVSKHEDEQRSQFVLVNNTKPLPKGLIHELLPSISAQLPKSLSARKIPASIAIEMNFTNGCPFKGLIRMPTNPNGIVAETSVQRMVGNSISNGVLRKVLKDDGDIDTDRALNLLNDYWKLVESIFSDAWGQPPVASRLMHGVGIVAMGNLMDYIAAKKPRGGAKAILEAIKPQCAWTKGIWKFPAGRIEWNALENTPKQASNLAKFLIHCADHVMG